MRVQDIYPWHSMANSALRVCFACPLSARRLSRQIVPSASLRFSAHPRPAFLPARSHTHTQDTAGTLGEILGWGYDREDSMAVESKLRTALVPIATYVHKSARFDGRWLIL